MRVYKYRCYTVYKDYCHFIVISTYLNNNRLKSYLQQTKTKLEEDRRIEKERYIEIS